MNVLIGCEFSGIVREEFRKRGHNAWSCDLLPTEIPGKHIQRNVLEVLNDEDWDLFIAFPPCTRLAVSGARWFKYYLKEQKEAIIFFVLLGLASVPKICIENPIGIMSTCYRKPDQIIQPWHEDNVGMHIWDLEKPNELFYKRLRNFVKVAKHKGIITCISLFDNWAIRSTWDSHPFNQKNNINDVRANRESWEWTSQKMKDVEYKLVEKVMQELKEYSDVVILEIGNENQESQGWHGEIISWINHINGAQKSNFKISLNTIGDDNWQLGNNYYSVHNVDSKKIARKAGPGCIFSTDGLPSEERYNSNHIYKIALETFKRNGHFSQHSTAKDISNMEEASKPNEAILDAIMRAKRSS